jgi:hypothetical protein
MNSLDTVLEALRDARRELADYVSRHDDVGTIIARDGCYISPQMGTEEDMVLGKLMGILNNERLVAAMRRVERRSLFKIVGPNGDG